MYEADFEAAQRFGAQKQINEDRLVRFITLCTLAANAGAPQWRMSRGGAGVAPETPQKLQWRSVADLRISP